MYVLSFLRETSENYDRLRDWGPFYLYVLQGSPFSHPRGSDRSRCSRLYVYEIEWFRWDEACIDMF